MAQRQEEGGTHGGPGDSQTLQTASPSGEGERVQCGGVRLARRHAVPAIVLVSVYEKEKSNEQQETDEAKRAQKMAVRVRSRGPSGEGTKGNQGP